MFDNLPDPGAIDAIVQARHGDPFALLGPHPVEGGIAVSTFVPNVDWIEVLARDTGFALGSLKRVHEAGFWSGTFDTLPAYRFRIGVGDITFETEDPYSYPPLLGDVDIYLLAEGRHRDFSAALGAHVVTIDGVAGTRFAVWAPNARRVSVVGDFNFWDGRRHPMRLRHGPGVWEIFVPRVTAGMVYKYEIMSAWGEVLPLKADPVAQATERPPRTGSVVPDPAEHVWADQAWMAGRAARQRADAPISIYEVHAMSWLPNAERQDYTWDDLADRLVPYVQRMGFTHLELMPVMEHPFGGSWGYQPLSQFAPTARLGAPAGFARFDGTALYEHQDPREGFHQDWNTFIYNHGRNEVRAFLIGSGLFWLEKYHVDGLRVDAVASMLYRDYSRKAGEWVPNCYGGRENLEAISFFRELSQSIAERVPGAVMIAEESTAFPGVSRPAEEGGLGFDFKWNMGWMHDTLHYMEEQPVYRKWHHGEMTFGLVYAFSERFVLPLSHDEVVYGKGSLIGKMPGDDWQKFANLRAYFGFMWSHPGKKLLFMGGDIAQWREWNHDIGLDWFLLDNPMNRGVQSLLADLNAAYRAHRAMHVQDADPNGFRWVVLNDAEQSVFAYLRYGTYGDPSILVVCNFTPVPRYGYRLGVPYAGQWREIVNTDAAQYGGSNMGNFGAVYAEDSPSHDLPAALVLTLPPLATTIFVGSS